MCLKIKTDARVGQDHEVPGPRPPGEASALPGPPVSHRDRAHRSWFLFHSFHRKLAWRRSQMTSRLPNPENTLDPYHPRPPRCTWLFRSQSPGNSLPRFIGLCFSVFLLLGPRTTAFRLGPRVTASVPKSRVISRYRPPPARCRLPPEFPHVASAYWTFSPDCPKTRRRGYVPKVSGHLLPRKRPPPLVFPEATPASHLTARASA